MQKILRTYKLRLTNISQGSRALKLAKLSTRRDIDWCDLGFLENESPEELLQKVMAGKDLRLIQKLDARFEKTNIVDKRLSLIYREVQGIFEESGTQDLYVGYPFVEGKFADGTALRCPVLLFPVNLIRNLQGKPRWMLKKPEDAEILFNPTFFLAYQSYQSSHIPKEFWEDLPEYSEDWQDFLNKLYEKLKKYEIEINFNSDLFDRKIGFFNPYLKETFDSFQLGQLIFKSQAVLGIFPQSDSALMQDYETIEANPENFDLAGLFEPKEEKTLAVEFRPEFMPEESRFFVTDLDQSQEDAILKVKAGKSIVLHGPPGTGKSQVIVNLIAEGLAQGKKMLIVSQKRAALDVVYKRLKGLGLGRFAALVHDQQSDRLAIFQKIRQQIEDIPTFQKEVHEFENHPQTNAYEVWARQADALKFEFEQIYKVLTQKQTCGLSAHLLYLQCDREKATLNLAAPAAKMDVLLLQQALTKFSQLMDYAEFFAKNYAWSNRLSFHHFRHEDKSLLGEKIEKLLLDIQELSPPPNPYIFLNEGNQIEKTYQKVQQIIEDSFLEEGIAAIYKDNLSERYIEKTLTSIQTHFKDLAKCGMLEGQTWENLRLLREKVQIYHQKKKDIFRLASADYRKSVDFIEKIFQAKNTTWNETNFSVLEKELSVFQSFLDLYLKMDEYAFFHDFHTEVLFQGYNDWAKDKNAIKDFQVGLLLQGWNEWLDAKFQQFEAWKFIHQLTDLPTYKPVFVNGQLDAEKWKETSIFLQKWEEYKENLAKKRGDWAFWLHEKQIEKIENVLAEKEDADFLTNLQSSFLSDFEDLKQLDSLIANFSEAENEILAAIIPLLQGTEGLKPSKGFSPFKEHLLSQITHSIYFYWLQNIEKENPDLLEVSTRGFARKQDDFSNFLSKKQSETNIYLQYVLKKRISENTLSKNLKELYHQTSKKRRLWTVRKLMQETWKQGLHTLMPCWLASPESVAAIFPMEKDYFDWVIFDEASQCFVERALPVMLRGEQIVIVGDSKQLQPFDMYSVRYDEGESEDVGAALEVESALDLAKTHLEQAHLNWHYRSQDEELINFSNQAFYEGKLQVLPSAEADTVFQPPLEWIAVEGQWQNNQNQVEAERVLELILEWVQSENPPSIGVVTFNFHQQELIKDLIDKKLEELAVNNTDLYEKLQASLQKTENEEFVGLFVKNIENVQGDERDMIIFSLAYSKNEQGKLSAQFGLLNLQGGENRLNVAITRAKKKIYVVCSFQPSELSTEGAKYEGPKLLKSYLQYVKAISEGRGEEARNYLVQTHNQAITQESANPIADFIAEKLQEKGFFIQQNFGDTRYKIDIVVKANAEARAFLLAIECEGSHYFSGASTKEREVYRRQLLLQKGWKVHRIWARNFWLDKEKEWKKVEGLLE